MRREIHRKRELFEYLRRIKKIELQRVKMESTVIRAGKEDDEKEKYSLWG